MRNKSSKLFIFLCLVIVSGCLYAQENHHAVIPGGGDNTGSNGSVSYSIGQMQVQTYEGVNGSMATGVQQPYEISVISELSENALVGNILLAYPNPVTDKLILKTDFKEDMTLTYCLYDISGKVLLESNINSNEIEILMSGYLPATYFLKVNSGNSVLKVFKIIKN